jgi:murein DD-endopeptidase MepM/ murein hydrolase activator NlpD
MPLRGMAGSHALRFYRWRNGARALTAMGVTESPATLDVWIELKPVPDAGQLGPPEDAGGEAPEPTELPEEEEWDGGSDAGGNAGARPADAGTPDAGKPPYRPKEPALTGVVELIPPHFPARELNLAPKYIHPPKTARERMAEDNKAIREAYRQPFRPPLFSTNFVWPRASEITSHFGDQRTLNGQQKSQHYGTDLDGRVGDPIRASNEGIVVLARDCYASGNTVLIHHGLKLYTAYFHMSKMDVQPGDHVKRGQSIGKVGKTGRVTGPHLHFGVKLNGEYVNPESVLRLNFE